MFAKWTTITSCAISGSLLGYTSQTVVSSNSVFAQQSFFAQAKKRFFSTNTNTQSQSQSQVLQNEQQQLFLDLPEFQLNRNTDAGANNNNNSNNSIPLIVLNESECRQLFPMSSAIDIQGQAFQSAFVQETIVPERIILGMPSMPENNDTLFKPAAISKRILGQKIVSVRPQNPSVHNLPSITGCILLLNIETGIPLMIMNAEFITGRRTAAGSGYATKLLSNVNSKQLVVFGSGVQAEEHIRAMLSVRGHSIERIFIINRNLQNAIALKEKFDRSIASARSGSTADAESKSNADDTRAAAVNVNVNVNANADMSVNPNLKIACLSLSDFQRHQHSKYQSVIADADIICTCTASSEPLFDGTLIKQGVHLNCVGAYKPNMREIDGHVISQCDFILVDSEHAFFCGDLFEYDCESDAGRDANYTKKMKLPCDWNTIGEYSILCDALLPSCAVSSAPDSENAMASHATKCTLFESAGTAAQDLHSAYFVYQQAVEQQIGTIAQL